MIIRIFLASSLLAGCAGSFRAFQEAPDWYEQRRTEIAGAGYPNVAEVPEVDPGARPGESLPRDRVALSDAELAFLTDPRAAPPDVTPEELRAWSAKARAVFAAVETPPDVLTPDEIEAMRRIFDKYPAGG